MQAGLIILEYCEKRLGQLELHTLGDFLLHLGNALPQELQLNGLVDIAEGLDYMHKQGVASTWRHITSQCFNVWR